MLTKEAVMKELKEVYDPEIPVNIVDMGLIYDVLVKGSNVKIKMTLTAPGCPMSSFIMQEVHSKVTSLKEVKNVDVELVFNPPWTPERMNKAIRKKFGF